MEKPKPMIQVRKSIRKRVPTKHLVYKDPKDKDETLSGKSKKKHRPGHKVKVEGTGASSPVSKVAFLVKKTYEKVRRNYTSQRATDIRSLWAENIQRLDQNLQDQKELRSKSVSSSMDSKLSGEDLVTAFKRVTSVIETSSDVAKFLTFLPETQEHKILKVTKTSVVTLPSLLQIPPVLAWTSIPYNIHEDDGKFLTNIPFLGDEIIDKDKKFIDDMVTLYEGKIHGISQTSKGTRMEEEVFQDFVDALMEVEHKLGAQVFEEEGSKDNMEIDPDGVSHPSEGVGPKLEIKPDLTLATAELSNPPGEDIKPILIDQRMPPPSKNVLGAISSTFKGIGTVDELKDRYEGIRQKKRLPKKLPLLPSGVEQHGPSSYSIPNIEGSYAKDLPKESAMHAYQYLFCRRCFQYDCTRGHNGDDHIDLKCYKKKRNPQSLNLSFVCEEPHCWQKKDSSVSVATKSKEEILEGWTPGDKSMFRCLIDSFQSHCYVSKLMLNKSCTEVHEYASLENIPTGELDSAPQKDGEPSQKLNTTTSGKRRAKPWNKKSSSDNKKNVARRWINNVKRSEKTSGGIKTGGVLPPKFMPCQHDHSMECDDKNPLCYCGKNGTSCEKFCGCPATCQRKFPGCRCTSTCDSKRCVCFFAARECDPDLCTGCGAHEPQVEKITCRNVNIQRRLHKHLLMGRSDVAGWGIFIKDEVQKGEFIAEYRGEIISHDESERRGHVYDKIQHTFLFELNDHFVVDATRKGNKSRFVNSSKNPNCEVKRMLVNGDHRIGIYAKRCIEAGEELFYDYEDVIQKQQKVSAVSSVTSNAPTTLTSSLQSSLPQS